MARGLTSATLAILSTLHTAPAATAAWTAFPADNVQDYWRQDLRIDQVRPKLIDGRIANVTRLTDVLVHSQDLRKKESLVDYLYPFQWEVEWEAAPILKFCREWWWVSYAAASMYLLALWAGKSVMIDRKEFGLKGPLKLWNLFLAVFSFVGTIRTLPQLMLMLSTHGFDYTLCRAAIVGYGGGAAGLWTWFFIFSKYFELIDTVFLVLRKRKVGFLHWYHHMSVLMYCWHSYVWQMPTGIYFIVMNYSVHSVMYFYYFLAAVMAKPPKWALFVTIIQLSQMAVGMFITMYHIYILSKNTVSNCDGHIPNLAAALGMYSSYFILFAQFLVKRYCNKRAPTDAKKVN